MAAGRCKFRLSWYLLLFVTNGYYSSVSALTTIQPLSLNVFAGENAVFECNVDELPGTVWQWFKGDYVSQEIIASENAFTLNGYEFIVNNGRQTSRITILNTTMEDDQTQYYCQFTSVSNIANLVVVTMLDPSYPQCEADITAINTKKTVTMTCKANGGDPRPALQWYKDDTAMKQKEFVNVDDGSYYVGYKHSVVPKDEGDVFICKAEGLAVKGSRSCSVRLNIPPTVIVSADSTVFYDSDNVTFVCAAETPFTIAGYQWFVNSHPVTLSGLQSHLEDDGRVMSLSDLNQNQAPIEVGCNVTTASGLVGSDVIKLEYIDKTSRPNDSNVTMVVCLSLAIVCAFFVGVFISRVVKCNFLTQLKESVCAGADSNQMARNTTNSNVNKGINPAGDVPVYQNSTFKMSSGKTAPPIEGIREETSYSSLNPVACSTYAELNPATIDWSRKLSSEH